MEEKKENVVLTTPEACKYLRISRPTYFKYLYAGMIKGRKVGKGWKVFKWELDSFLRGENGKNYENTLRHSDQTTVASPET